MALRLLVLLALCAPHAAVTWYVADALKKDSSCDEVCGTWTLQCIDSCFPRSLSSVNEALESICKHKVVTYNATTQFHPSVEPRDGKCTLGFHGSCTALPVTPDAAQEQGLWIQRICPCGAHGQTCITAYVLPAETAAPPESTASANTWVVVVILLLVVIIVLLICLIRQRVYRKQDTARNADKTTRRDVWGEKNDAPDDVNQSADRHHVGIDDNIEIIEVNEVAPEPEPGRWRCDVCHFDNYDDAQCRACTRTRGAVARRSFQTVNELVSSTSKRINDALLGNSTRDEKPTGRCRSSSYRQEADFFAACREGGPNWNGTIVSGLCFEQCSPVSSPMSIQVRSIYDLSTKDHSGVDGASGPGQVMHARPPVVPQVPLMLPEPEGEDVADMPRAESPAAHPNARNQSGTVSKPSVRHEGFDSKLSREHFVDSLRAPQKKSSGALCFQQPHTRSITSDLPLGIPVIRVQTPEESGLMSPNTDAMMASVESSGSVPLVGLGLNVPPHDGNGVGSVGVSPARSSTSLVCSPVRAVKCTTSLETLPCHASRAGQAASGSSSKVLRPARGTSPDTAGAFHRALTKTSEQEKLSAWSRKMQRQMRRDDMPPARIAAGAGNISSAASQVLPLHLPPSTSTSQQPLKEAKSAWHHVPPPLPTKMHTPHKDTEAVHAQSMAPALIEGPPNTQRSPSVMTLASGPSSVDLTSFAAQRPPDPSNIHTWQKRMASNASPVHTHEQTARTVAPPRARHTDDLPHLPPPDRPRMLGAPYSKSAQADNVWAPGGKLNALLAPIPHLHHAVDTTTIPQLTSFDMLKRPDNSLLPMTPDRPNALPPRQDRVSPSRVPCHVPDLPQDARAPTLPTSITDAPKDTPSAGKKVKKEAVHAEKDNTHTQKRHVHRPESSESRGQRCKPAHRSTNSGAEDCMVVESIEENVLPEPSNVENVLQRARDRQMSRSTDASYVNARKNAEKSLSKLQAIIAATGKKTNLN